MKIIGKSGKHYRYEPSDKRGKGAIEFWAENGMVCMLDERFPSQHPGHFTIMTRREFLLNLKAINFSIPRAAYAVSKSVAASGGNAGGAASEERELLHKLIENGIECAKEAGRQGDPANPRHLSDMIKERRKAMLLAGTSCPPLGALSQDVAPEASKLPELGIPGVTHRSRRKR